MDIEWKEEKFGRLVPKNEIIIEDIDEEDIINVAEKMHKQGNYNLEYWKAPQQTSGHLHIRYINLPTDISIELANEYRVLIIKKYVREELWKEIDWNFYNRKEGAEPHRIVTEGTEHYKGYGIKTLINSWGEQNLNPVEENILEQAKKNIQDNSIKNLGENYKRDYEDLINKVIPHWKEGNRQNVCMYLAGYLRKNARLGIETAKTIISEVCSRAGDTELKMRLTAVDETYKKDEKDIKGISGLDFLREEETAEPEERILSPEEQTLQTRVISLLSGKHPEIAQATELLVDYIEANNYIYTTKDDIKEEVWLYQEGIYIPNGKSYIKEVCRRILGRAYNNYLANVVLSKIETDTFIHQDKFFENKYVDEIPVQNGILNVLTRKLKPYNPEQIFFSKMPVIYVPTALNPHIEKFLKDILDKEEDLLVMYEVFGSGLYKEYFTEKAVMLVGNGRNGKSKLLELFKRLVGIENCCSVPIRSMNETNSSLCELYSRLFNLAGDLSGGDLKDTGVFKQTVGRDTLQTHRKYLRDLIFVNYAKHIFACNELPRVFDTTDGFWDKWVLINFPYKFVTKEEYDKLSPDEKLWHKIKDPDIINKISTPEELSGLLNRALDGLDRLLKQKNYSQTKGTKEIKDFWIRNSDSFTAFCLDSIKQDNTTYLTKKELRLQFNIYCKKFGLKGAGDKSIKATLEDRYGVVEGRKVVNDEQQFIWEGINFKWRL